MNNTFWIEIKRFMKDNYKKMLMGAFLFAVAYPLMQYFLGNNEKTEITGIPESYIEGDFEPAYFRFYVEREDGAPFLNTTLLEDYFLLDHVVADVEQDANVNISGPLKEQEESEFVPEGNNRGVLGVLRGTFSDIFTLIVNIGSPEENLSVAEEYFDRVTNDEVTFLADKNVYVMVEPTILDDPEELGLAELDVKSKKADGWLSILINASIGFVVGLTVSLIGLMIYSLFKNTITYSFSYNWDEDDIHLLYDEQLGNEDELVQTVLHPLVHSKVVLAQHGVPAKLEELLKTKRDPDQLLTKTGKTNLSSSTIYEANSIGEMNPGTAFDEVVVIIQPGKTEKKWYRKQRRMLKNYNTSMKVIQMND